jgi:hypothetical protein
MVILPGFDSNSEGDALYTRMLPGGGYVLIEAKRGEEAELRLTLSVERRVDPQRRAGHAPPIVAESSHPDAARAASELLKIAADNVEVAQALRRWQAAQAAQVQRAD